MSRTDRFLSLGPCVGYGSGATERPGRASADRKVVRARFRDMYPANERYVVRFVGLSPALGPEIGRPVEDDVNGYWSVP